MAEALFGQTPWRVTSPQYGETRDLTRIVDANGRHIATVEPQITSADNALAELVAKRIVDAVNNSKALEDHAAAIEPCEQPLTADW